MPCKAMAHSKQVIWRSSSRANVTYHSSQCPLRQRVCCRRGFWSWSRNQKSKPETERHSPSIKPRIPARYIYVLSLKWHDQRVFSDTCSDHMQRHAERAISFAFWKICHFAVIFPSCKILQQNEKFSCQQNPTAKFDLFKAGKCENFKLILQQCQI